MNKSTKLKYLEKSYDNDVLWRFSISSDEDLTNLYLEGVDETTLEEWLKPVGYIPHKMRRLRCFTWNDKETLSDFWHILENEISSNGVLVNQDTKIRVINDEPGKYFGKYDSKEPEGRWSEKVTDGIWCGCRRGYNEKHWHRIIISVSGNERRALDLFDEDEWRWALLAKSFNKGYDEVVNISSDNEVDVTFPLPYQLENALSILGPKTGPWQWKLSPGAPNLFDYIH